MNTPNSKFITFCFGVAILAFSLALVIKVIAPQGFIH